MAFRSDLSVYVQTGQVDRTEDHEFQEESQKFKTYVQSIRIQTALTNKFSLEKNVNVLQKEAKAYLDAMKGMTAAQARIGQIVDDFFGDNSDAAMTAHAYRRAVEELDSKNASSFEQPFRATVLEPVGKMAAHMPEIKLVLC